MAKTVNRAYCITQAYNCLHTADQATHVTQSEALTNRATAWIRLGELIGEEQFTASR